MHIVAAVLKMIQITSAQWSRGGSVPLVDNIEEKLRNYITTDYSVQ